MTATLLISMKSERQCNIRVKLDQIVMVEGKTVSKSDNRQTHYMDSIKPITRLPTPPAFRKSTLTTLHGGRRYHLNGPDPGALNSTHGVCGGYQMSLRCAEILPVTPPSKANDWSECYFWDADIALSKLHGDIKRDGEDQSLSLEDCSVRTNRLILNHTQLSGPEIIVRDKRSILTLSPRFDLTYSTDSDVAQLGVIHLVQATRFIMLENGDKIPLLDTGDEESPALYLENIRNDKVIDLLADPQASGLTQQHTYCREIGQPIPDEVAGETVATVTVLEQYWSYFMQRTLTTVDDLAIWIPAYAPLSWGWSIRVGRRTDGEWGILRRKVILPTTGHDGFQFPVWNTNTVERSILLKT